MKDLALPVVLAFITSGLGLIAQVVISRRSKSGTPRTAEAETLFDELVDLKNEYRAEMKTYRLENEELRKIVTQQDKRIAELEHRLSIGGTWTPAT